eukprot:COSAG06_NODE_1742_length_8503_cov_6.223703_3_plen_62_part_00
MSQMSDVMCAELIDQVRRMFHSVEDALDSATFEKLEVRLHFHSVVVVVVVVVVVLACAFLH